MPKRRGGDVVDRFGYDSDNSRDEELEPPVPPPPPPHPDPARVQFKPRPAVHRNEALSRQLLHLGQGCVHNQCPTNREFDPFCICRKESRPRSTVQPERRAQGTPAGLKNLGNTCYMNSYLQTLFHTLPVRRTLYAWRLPPPDQRDPNKKYEMVEELRNLFASMQSTMEASVSPANFVRAAGINNGNQQDAREFQVLFLEWLDEVIAERAGEEKLQSFFKGRMRSTIRFRGCAGESSGETAFHNFTLPTKDLDDVMQSLTVFFADEQIDGYACRNCGHRRVADRKMKPVALPRFLNLHLLRYYYDRVAKAQKKLSHPVRFLVVVDLRPFLPEEKIREWGAEGCRYQLMAILIHVGDAYGGHYFARIRVATDGKWYTFNDAWVTRYAFNEMDLDARNAYLLVYEKEREIEDRPAMPVLPQNVHLPNHGQGGAWQAPNLRRRYGTGTRSVERFLRGLKVGRDDRMVWLPSDWLTDVARAVRGDVDVSRIPAPVMSGQVCRHGRLANLRGLKAVSAVGIEKVFDLLAAAPFPCILDGSMFCEECASSDAAFSKHDEAFGL